MRPGAPARAGTVGACSGELREQGLVRRDAEHRHRNRSAASVRSPLLQLRDPPPELGHVGQRPGLGQPFTAELKPPVLGARPVAADHHRRVRPLRWLGPRLQRPEIDVRRTRFEPQLLAARPLGVHQLWRRRRGLPVPMALGHASAASLAALNASIAVMKHR
jgi:hypothetical protein